MCMGVSAHVPGYPGRPEEESRSLRAGDTSKCELLEMDASLYPPGFSGGTASTLKGWVIISPPVTSLDLFS